MCLDDSNEVSKPQLLAPVVITETHGVRVEFFGGAGCGFDDALPLLINECIKHGKPVVSVDYRLERASAVSDPLAQVGVLIALWASEEELSEEQKERREFARTLKEKFK